MSAHATYANALAAVEDFQGAVEQIEHAYEISEGDAPHINAQYVNILYQAGEYQKAVEAGRSSIVRNKTNDELMSTLREAYIELHGSDDKYLTFVKKAEEEAVTVLREVFAERMLEEPAPEFELPRLNGDPVNMADLKGKVVVIDFWATWCGPCIMAFPHFQKVVEHYEDNPDVVFLAINAWEGEYDEERIGKVTEFIEENGYTFPVIFDVDDEVIASFGVRGIPTRFAVGRDGSIKFRDVGFSGPGMVQDMIVQIDMLLEEEGPLTTK